MSCKFSSLLGEQWSRYSFFFLFFLSFNRFVGFFFCLRVVLSTVQWRYDRMLIPFCNDRKLVFLLFFFTFFSFVLETDVDVGLMFLYDS